MPRTPTGTSREDWPLDRLRPHRPQADLSPHDAHAEPDALAALGDGIAARLGVSGRTLDRNLQLLSLPLLLQRAFDAGTLSLRQGIRIAALGAAEQEEIARQLEDGVPIRTVLAQRLPAEG